MASGFVHIQDPADERRTGDQNAGVYPTNGVEWNASSISTGAIITGASLAGCCDAEVEFG